MSRATSREVRAAVGTRDAFLAVVAAKLDAQVSELRAAASKVGGADPAMDRLRGSLEELQGFARELHVIADPRRPVPLRLRRLELGATITRTLAAFQERMARSEVTLEITRGGSVVGRWDRDHLATILGELLSNAVKYGGGRPVVIRLAVRGASVELVVQNQGAWVGPKDVFERFRRGETRRRVRGFGVGLWLTRRLAEAHGGRVRFTHRGGETSAIVSLPFDEIRGEISRFQVRLQRAAPPP